MEAIQRRAVTKRTSRTMTPEPLLRKQDASKLGQTWLEQAPAALPGANRSALGKATASSAFT
jgi:hypothetical protein